MREKTYTIDQIKAAFWAQFHESGELWFSYCNDPEGNQEVTESKWEDFLEDLERAARNSAAGAQWVASVPPQRRAR